MAVVVRGDTLSAIARRFGTTVADIVAGTGFLGFLAAKLGAKRVDLYANCFVKRDHTTKALQPDRRLDDPPAGLALRDLTSREED